MNKEQHIKNNDVINLMLQQEAIIEYKYWKIIEAWFPYRNIRVHHLLIPKEKFMSLKELPVEYILELNKIESDILEESYYNHIRINSDNDRPYKDLVHKHLIKELI